MNNNRTIPDRFRKYYWDCVFEDLDIDLYPEFIAERILNFGDIDSLNWLLSQIDSKFLISLISTSKNINKKTKNFWHCMLNEKISY